MTTGQESSIQAKKVRKKRVRSPYLFPAYDFGTARRIAEKVEQDGAGSLTEETLAIALNVSTKSSGYRLRTLAARQFKLLTKQGETLSTTPLAKAMLKPTTEEEKTNATVESFMAIPLFKAVATRFKGQPLPQGQAFRNILERELRIESNRVGDAERILMDSAREASLLHQSGGKTYLTTEIVPKMQPGVPQGPISSSDRFVTPPSGELTQPPSGLLTVSEQDLADFDDKEFNEIWNALGKVIRARGKRQRFQEEQLTSENIEEKEESAEEEDIPF